MINNIHDICVRFIWPFHSIALELFCNPSLSKLLSMRMRLGILALELLSLSFNSLFKRINLNSAHCMSVH